MQPITHAVLDVAFKVTVVPKGVVVGGAGMTQRVWQFDACELHNIMQFVTVEVMGVRACSSGLCVQRLVPAAWQGWRR